MMIDPRREDQQRPDAEEPGLQALGDSGQLSNTEGAPVPRGGIGTTSMEQPTARIFLRPIGSPVTIGMAGLSIASLVQGGLVVLGLAAYAVLAFELEGQRHRPLLPTFRRGRAARAIYGDPEAQVDGVTSEAGVRQTT